MGMYLKLFHRHTPVLTGVRWTCHTHFALPPLSQSMGRHIQEKGGVHCRCEQDDGASDHHSSASRRLRHGDKSASFTALCRGGAPILKDAESLVQRHRCLLWKETLKGSMLRDSRHRKHVELMKPDAANTNRFPNTVNVELKRHTFRYLLLCSFHFDGSRTGCWGM